MHLARPRVVFMGTPDLARVILRRLAFDNRFEIVGVIAQPDRPAGRNLLPLPPPVKVEALALGLPVWQPEKARDPEFLQVLKRLAPDVIVVAAYGQLLPTGLLEIPVRGCVNLHTSILPRWRGAAPIQWAIASGDPETGVTLMKMEAGLDTGPILAISRTPIGPQETSDQLHDRLAALAASLLLDRLPGYLEGQLPEIQQPLEGVTYARKITREDGRIDWTQPATVLDLRRRAFTPWPGAFCFLPQQPRPKLIKIFDADVVEGRTEDTGQPPGTVVSSQSKELIVVCGKGAWRILELQPEGGKRMTAAQFLAGNRIEAFG